MGNTMLLGSWGVSAPVALFKVQCRPSDSALQPLTSRSRRTGSSTDASLTTWMDIDSY
jgi:hypothetical protein